MVSIRVVDWSGNPIKHVKVHISWEGGGIFGSYSSEFTDENGYANFYVGTGNGTIYVDGHIVHQGHVSGLYIFRV